MGDGFVCSICGQAHEGLATDWAFKLPDEVWAIPADEREELARFNDDLCMLGERHFIRCVLAVRFKDRPGEFGWGIWAEVGRPVFERYLELDDKDGSSEPVHPGTIANDLPPYPAMMGAPVAIQFRDPSQRPSLFLPDGDKSPLAHAQRTGIDDARYHAILNIIRPA